MHLQLAVILPFSTHISGLYAGLSPFSLHSSVCFEKDDALVKLSWSLP